MKTILSGSIFNSGIATLGTLLFLTNKDIGKVKYMKNIPFGTTVQSVLRGWFFAPKSTFAPKSESLPQKVSSLPKVSLLQEVSLLQKLSSLAISFVVVAATVFVAATVVVCSIFQLFNQLFN